MTSLRYLALSLINATQPVRGINCTDCQEREECISWGDPCPSCLGNINRAPRVAYLPHQHYWWSRISAEMRDGIDVFQSIYARSGKTFSDGPPSEQLDVSLHIDRRVPERLKSTGREVPSFPKVMDAPSSGRGISSVRPSLRGDSKYAPRGSDDHHASPPDVVVEVGTPGLTRGLD